MKEKDAAEGVEVTHPIQGRGVVTECHPHFGSEPDEVTVWFYESDNEQILPIYVVRLAQEMVTTSVDHGSYGFHAVVDDGHCTVVIHPDGTGEGYSIDLLLHGEIHDYATLSWDNH